MSLNKDKRLASLYFDAAEPAAYSSIKNLYDKAQKEKWTDIKRNDVKKFLHKTKVYTLHKQYKRGKIGKIFAWGINYLWEIGIKNNLFYTFSYIQICFKI